MWVTTIFFIRNPQKTKMLTFSIYIKSKNENMNRNAKISDQDDADKSFEIQPILPLFGQK